MTQPSAFASGLTGVVDLQASTSDPSVASVEFQIDGDPLGTDASAPYAPTVDSNAFASGQHVLRARGHRCHGQSVGLDQRDRAVRRLAHAAGRLHAQRQAS